MISTGQNIFLRRPVNKDAGIMLKWENDPEVWTHGDNKEEYSLKDLENFIKEAHNLHDHGQARYMVCDIKDERVLGCVDLYEYNPEKKSAGVGILIYETSDRNNGIGSETLRLLIDYCNHKLKLKALFCRIANDNEISLSLFKKAGFSANQEIQQKIGNNRPVYLELSLN